MLGIPFGGRRRTLLGILPCAFAAAWLGCSAIDPWVVDDSATASVVLEPGVPLGLSFEVAYDGVDMSSLWVGVSMIVENPADSSTRVFVYVLEAPYDPALSLDDQDAVEMGDFLVLGAFGDAPGRATGDVAFAPGDEHFDYDASPSPLYLALVTEELALEPDVEVSVRTSQYEEPENPLLTIEVVP